MTFIDYVCARGCFTRIDKVSSLLTAGLALSSFKDIHARAMIAGNLQVYYSTQVQVK